MLEDQTDAGSRLHMPVGTNHRPGADLACVWGFFLVYSNNFANHVAALHVV